VGVLVTVVPASTEGARSIGVLHGCLLDVVPDTLWHVAADLAVAGIHLGDPAPAVLAGLEMALGGGFETLRGAGLLSGRLGETLLLSRPPAPIRAGAVLIVGLGTSEAVTADAMRRAARAAADQAVRMQVDYVASACGTDDGTGTSRLTRSHLWASISGIEGILRTSRQPVRRWSFLVPAADLERFADRLRSAFDQAIRGEPPTA
jgi:hypothetical protein